MRARPDPFVGVVLMAYEMLAGTLPIEGAPDGTSLPTSMRDAIMRGLAKSADERFSTINALVDRFTARA